MKTVQISRRSMTRAPDEKAIPCDGLILSIGCAGFAKPARIEIQPPIGDLMNSCSPQFCQSEVRVEHQHVAVLPCALRLHVDEAESLDRSYAFLPASHAPSARRETAARRHVLFARDLNDPLLEVAPPKVDIDPGGVDTRSQFADQCRDERNGSRHTAESILAVTPDTILRPWPEFFPQGRASVRMAGLAFFHAFSV